MLYLFLVILHSYIIRADLFLKLSMRCCEFLLELLHDCVLLINLACQRLLNRFDLIVDWGEVCFEKGRQFLANSSQDFILQVLNVCSRCAGLGVVAAVLGCNAYGIHVACFFLPALFIVVIGCHSQVILDCLGK